MCVLQNHSKTINRYLLLFPLLYSTPLFAKLICTYYNFYCIISWMFDQCLLLLLNYFPSFVIHSFLYLKSNRLSTCHAPGNSHYSGRNSVSRKNVVKLNGQKNVALMTLVKVTTKSFWFLYHLKSLQFYFLFLKQFRGMIDCKKLYIFNVYNSMALKISTY